MSLRVQAVHRSLSGLRRTLIVAQLCCVVVEDRDKPGEISVAAAVVACLCSAVVVAATVDSIRF